LCAKVFLLNAPPPQQTSSCLFLLSLPCLLLDVHSVILVITAIMGPRAGLSLLYSQFFVKLPIPTNSFSGQTIIVTGSNTGLGREAANHIVRLGASKVILAVRNIRKGEDAKKYIEGQTGRTDVVKVWELDLASYASVKAFAGRVEGLERLDAVLENAGISAHEFELAEDNEYMLLHSHQP
jgi:retinol dehydrogenase 12